jgi:hypothetical protein
MVLRGKAGVEMGVEAGLEAGVASRLVHAAVCRGDK